MNDKLKGLLLGLSLGVMMTGSIAYASGTQIEVYFKNIKYMFDGQEKKSGEESFIYNGTAYVPLRFVSEALGKPVEWDGDTETVWVGRKVEMANAIAIYKGGQVTLGEFEKFMSVMSLLKNDPPQQTYDENYKTSIVKQMIASRILYDRLGAADKDTIAASVDTQLNDVKDFLKPAAAGKDWDTFLSSYSLTDADLIGYLNTFLGAQMAAAGETELKAAYDKEVSGKNEQFIASESVRHILIKFKDAKGADRSKEELDKKLKEIQDQLKNGSDFAALAKQYSEDEGSREQGGLYKNAQVRSWVPAFKKAAIELELNRISEPVETEFGYHIIRVEERTFLPYEQVKNELQSALTTQAYKKLIEGELPELIQSIQFPK